MRQTLFDPGEPATGAELVAALTRVTNAGADALGTLPIERFFAAQGLKWSPADHARHLQKSSAPLVPALRLPAWLLRALFGRPHRPSRSFFALRTDYRAALGAGGQAGRFAPQPEASPSDPDARRRQILTHWQLTNRRLCERVMGWPEDQLDMAQLPHPLLGKLTVREMVAFTVYHTTHHLTLVVQRAEGGA